MNVKDESNDFLLTAVVVDVGNAFKTASTNQTGNSIDVDKLLFDDVADDAVVVRWAIRC